MTTAVLGEARLGARYFYVWMAAVCALLAIGAFVPTYWAQVPAGTFVGSNLVHIHAALFTAWPLLFFSQTWLEANDRLDHHRAWGILGVSLGTALFIVGAATALSGAAGHLAEGMPMARVLGFLIVPLSAITLFAIFFAAAIVYRRRTEVHRRLMLLATVAVLQAAIARVFFIVNTGGGPGMRPGVGLPAPVQTLVVPGLTIDLIVVAAILYDWRTRGRPHPVYLLGLGTLVAVQLLRAAVSATPQWLAFADGLVNLAR